MSGQSVEQAQLVPQAAISPLQSVTQFALFNADGTPFGDAGDGNQGVHVALVTAANGSDAGTTQTLANANKVAINALITSLQNAGFLASS